ncbi:MAG: hypothetical protein IMZ69_00435, partial [Spirochaetes bacterium]|nr:hypothetical protein [Spirochaetota bacterium]
MPATGTLQKGTVTLRALFKDDKELLNSSMQVSYDGGSSYQNIPGGDITYVTGSTNPYMYRIIIPIDTTTIDFDPGAGIVLGNGTLQISLKVTDKTYKQTTQTVQYNVDNTPPEVAWNLTGTQPGMTRFLSYQGTPPNEIYSFYGSGSTVNNEVFGMAHDRGTISGIAKVNVYFVKVGNFINPTSGALLATSNQTVRHSSLDLNDDGDYIDSGEYTGTDQSIPFTENTGFVITIDKRTELGQFDTNPTLGDNDGFNESLKAKSGYDEWYAYFTSTVLPDGPIDVYFVAYDEAGNRVYDKAIGQVTNSPPSITGFSVGGVPLSGNPIKVKYSGTVSLTVDASDAGSNPGVTAASWKVTVTNHYNASGGDVGTEITPFATFFYGTGGVADFSSRGSGSPASGTVAINTLYAGFTEGDWYKLAAEVTDNDGNVALGSFYLRVNNTDATNPTVTIDDLSQTSIDMWTSKTTPLSIDVQTANVNAGTDLISVALPSWVVNNTRVVFAGITAPVGLSAGTVYYVVNNTGSQFQLAASSGGAAVDITNAGSGTYFLASGGHVEGKADSLYDNTPTDADVSGTLRLSGTVADDTDVQSLTITIDGGAAITLTPTNKRGGAVTGYTYDWSYLWDSSRITTVAKANVSILLTARDFKPNTGTAPLSVDVLPYVTSITDPSGLSTDVLRSSNGKYSIQKHATNTLTVRGYNLGRAGYAPTSWVSPTNTAWASGSSASPTWSSVNEILVSKNWTRSGHLTIAVNTQPSGNNLDNNGNANNLENGADPRTNKWNDDRYL